VSLLFISTLYMQNVLGYSPFQAGLVFVPLGIEEVLSFHPHAFLVNLNWAY
jgi:hypothetical protein